MQLRPGCVHMDGSSVELSAVQGSDCRFRRGIVSHFDKCKASGLTRFAVRHDPEAFHRTVFLKYGSNVLLRSVRTEVPNENIIHLSLPIALWKRPF